ncbi:MAG: hypothetical protein WA393_05230 [Nitrososphaeraceae archaeon]
MLPKAGLMATVTLLAWQSVRIDLFKWYRIAGLSMAEKEESIYGKGDPVDQKLVLEGKNLNW